MDTRPEGLSVNGAGIKFRSLSLGGVRGKVRATLNENQVSFESRNGQALDIRLNAIKRVHHHDTTLVPGWLAFVGLIFVWVAWRGITGKFQALLGAAGIVISAAHYITKQPTLIIDTNAEDCHVVYGPDLTIMRLCALIQRIQNGMTLEEAKASVDNIVSDSDYPRSINSEELEAIPEPVEVFPSAVISHFLDSMDEEEIFDAEVVSPAIVIEDLDIPIWEDEPEVEPQISEGLLARSKSNLFTQRNQVMQNGWQQPANQSAYNQVHRTPPSGVPSYEMLNQQNIPPSYSQPMPPQPTPIPTEFLPSFVGSNGAHIPNAGPESFSSPDTPLQPIVEEEVPSLVASARREVPLEAEIIPEEIESPRERYPKMRKLVAKPKNRRLKVRKTSGGTLRGRSVIAELISPTLGRASKISKKFLRKRTKSRTSDAIRLQAENNRQSQVAESIQNLAKSKGGNVSDEEVDKMMEHISPKPDIPSSFKDLVSSDAKNPEDVASIPRIDD